MQQSSRRPKLLALNHLITNKKGVTPTMAYSNNPNLPKARRWAINLVLIHSYTKAEAARKSGVHRSTITRWLNLATKLNLDNRENIPTMSSAPHSHPNSLSPEIIKAIVNLRLKHGRCAEVIHHQSLSLGIKVSLSSVKRTLKRQELTRKKSKWARYRPHIPRPLPSNPGDLVQIDTIHFFNYSPTTAIPTICPKDKFYVYTAIDLNTRWAYAEYHSTLNQKISLDFTLRAQEQFSKQSLGLKFSMIQTDNGLEFGKYYKDQLEAKDIKLRHSRVRRSNDNAHIERFNRTIQQEGFKTSHPTKHRVQQTIDQFINYYNNDRIHMSINFKTPNQMLRRC